MSNLRKCGFIFLSAAALLWILCGCTVQSGSTEANQTGHVNDDTAVNVSESEKIQQEPVNQAEAFEPEYEYSDIAGKVLLNKNSETKKQIVTVKCFVDGDTTHFYVPESVMDTGVLKARYLAVNTPESTGKVEEYGKTASSFTREKLESAFSILIESDDGNWNLDSTSTRYLVWVWYQPEEGSEYRNLNIELLQNGLAIASSSANNRYGSYCMEALQQARNLKLNLYSGKKDPDFYYGDAIELTLKELRANIHSYEGMKVAFEASLIRNSSNTVYAEDFDPETGLYTGIPVYYGFNLSGDGLNILTVGNRVRIVGTVQYYETGDSWQISGVAYKAMHPDDPGNLQKLGEGVIPAYPVVSAETFLNGKVTPYPEQSSTSAVPYAEFTLNSSICMHGLKVLDIMTVENEESGSGNAMTLNCECDGLPVTVRTTVLYDENRNVITADEYLGKTIDVFGLVDCFHGKYQIKVFTANDIVIIDE